MVLRIYGLRGDEVTGRWRRLYTEELYDLYSSPNIKRVIKSIIIGWTGQVAFMAKRRGAYRVLVARPEGKETIWKIQE